MYLELFRIFDVLNELKKIFLDKKLSNISKLKLDYMDNDL
jgi:hypothetical protein